MGKFFRMDEHLERFERSMAGLRLEIPYDRAAVAEIIHECVRRGSLRDSMVMVIATRGMVPPDGRRDLRKCTNGFIAAALPYHTVVTPEELEKGIDMIVSSVPRIPTESVDPRIKNFNRLDFCRALFEAYDRGANYAVLPDHEGNLTEGLGYNIFASRGGRLISPDWGVFEGITRRTVFEMCAETNVKAELVKMKADDLHAADEVFIASTAGGIMPVSTVDGAPVGDGTPGPADHPPDRDVLGVAREAGIRHTRRIRLSGAGAFRHLVRGNRRVDHRPAGTTGRAPHPKSPVESTAC